MVAAAGMYWSFLEKILDSLFIKKIPCDNYAGDFSN
jgi:hypothetical protein